MIKKYWPTTSIMKKPKFQVLIKWFKIVHSAYLVLRPKIPKFAREIPGKNKPHFDAVCDLLECYIPFVLLFEKTKNSNSFKFRLQMLRMQLFFLSALGSGPYVKVADFFYWLTDIKRSSFCS